MATYNATTVSYADVNSALALCSAGDTLSIPSGVVTWPSTLNVTIPIHIIGVGSSGVNRTEIDMQTGTIINFAPTTDAASSIKNIAFSKVAATAAVNVSILVSPVNRLTSGLWINNCTFLYGQNQIEIDRRTYGLISNCTFTDAAAVLSIYNTDATDTGSFGDTEWALGKRLGTTNAMVMENCNITYTSGINGITTQYVVDGRSASRFVMRHCTMNSTGTSATIYGPAAHGNYWNGTSEQYGRGTMAYEIYDNTFILNSSTPEAFLMRGGTLLYYNNIVTSSNGIMFKVWNNETWANVGGIHGFYAKDMLDNCHIYGNTFNGIAQGTGWDHGEPGAFNLYPDNSTGAYDQNSWSALYTPPSWVTARNYIQAADNVQPSFVGQSGNLYRCLVSHTSNIFATDLAANKWSQDNWPLYTRAPQTGDPIYPYTALTYPHPLFGSGITYIFKRLGSHLKFKGLFPV